MKVSYIYHKLTKDCDVPEFSHTGSLSKVLSHETIMDYAILVKRFGNLEQDKLGNLVEEPMWDNYVWQILECELFFDKHATHRQFKLFLTE